MNKFTPKMLNIVAIKHYQQIVVKPARAGFVIKADGLRNAVAKRIHNAYHLAHAAATATPVDHILRSVLLDPQHAAYMYPYHLLAVEAYLGHKLVPWASVDKTDLFAYVGLQLSTERLALVNRLVDEILNSGFQLPVLPKVALKKAPEMEYTVQAGFGKVFGTRSKKTMKYDFVKGSIKGQELNPTQHEKPRKFHEEVALAEMGGEFDGNEYIMEMLRENRDMEIDQKYKMANLLCHEDGDFDVTDASNAKMAIFATDTEWDQTVSIVNSILIFNLDNAMQAHHKVLSKQLYFAIKRDDKFTFKPSMPLLSRVIKSLQTKYNHTDAELDALEDVCHREELTKMGEDVSVQLTTETMTDEEAATIVVMDDF